ncbi:MAG: hypothetical protein IPI35_27710 [Deltaproteobacteria bacterium]|nr:hypothetical protein [Deltaproteobacteria bacterium]
MFSPTKRSPWLSLLFFSALACTSDKDGATDSGVSADSDTTDDSTADDSTADDSTTDDSTTDDSTTDDSAVVDCDLGYVLNTDGDCVDIDECVDGTNDCAADADCTNTEGSFSCECPSDMVGDGTECRPIWEDVLTIPSLSLTAGWGAVVFGFEGEIYFAPEGDVFFKSVDPNTGVVTDHPMPPASGTQSDWCACGYTEVVVPLDDAVYVFGNWGQVFRAGAWTSISSYSSVRRGESGGAAAAGKVWMIGGRDDGATVQTYSGGLSGTWETRSERYPADFSRGVAYTPIGSDTIYVFGGYNSAGDLTQGASFDTSSSGASWTPTATLPSRFYADDGQPAEHDGKILVSDGYNGLYVYIPSLDVWADTVVPFPEGGTGDWFLAVLDGTTYALGQVDGDIALKRLLNIQ